MQLLQINLDSLHKNLVDSQLGFKECASITKNDSWKHKFEFFAAKREQMMRDIEIYGASKSSSGTMSGGLSRAWMDIKASLTGGGQNVMDSVWKEETELKKTYENALKSHGIASALNGLLVDHIRKIDSDLIDLQSLFGDEGKHLITEEQNVKTVNTVNTVNTEQEPVQKKQSIGFKIKSALGIGEGQHDHAVHKQQAAQQQLSGRGFV